jgi:hypothetical protein
MVFDLSSWLFMVLRRALNKLFRINHYSATVMTTRR